MNLFSLLSKLVTGSFLISSFCVFAQLPGNKVEVKNELQKIEAKNMIAPMGWYKIPQFGKNGTVTTLLKNENVNGPCCA